MGLYALDNQSDCQASTKHLINDKLPKQLHNTILISLLLHISSDILVMDTGQPGWIGHGGELVQCLEQFYK